MDTGGSAMNSNLKFYKNLLVKEKIMKNTIKKISSAGLLILLTIVSSVCVAAAADINDVNTSGKEVLSAISQRMQKRISVDFRNTPIDDVIRVMAEQSGVDIIKSPKVIGNVTATLTDVPLDEALNNILAANGYGYIVGKNMIRIASADEMSEASEGLRNSIYHIDYANVKDVEDALKKFISPRGSLSSNIGTSDIIVTDSESRIKDIDTFIKQVDRITPQIEVEARIYDITSKDRMDLGIEWQIGKNTTYTSGGKPAFGNAGVLSTGENPTGLKNPFDTGVFSGSTGKTQSTTGAFRFGWLTPTFDIDMLLRAQKENIDAKLLANPRIMVLDNQQAKIKIVSQIPYQEITDTSAGGSIGSTAFKEVGVTLAVIPHLTREGMIRLQLKPEFSVQTGTVLVGTATNTFPQPVIDTRQADTTLLVENGRTVVLGGLRKKDTTKQINKIPFLGDLPVVGAAFKFTGDDSTISELVVFITPNIIDQPVLTETEQQQYKVTDFSGPKPVYTGAEKQVTKK
jgi:type IV pilus assembly protein PilQ